MEPCDRERKAMHVVQGRLIAATTSMTPRDILFDDDDKYPCPAHLWPSLLSPDIMRADIQVASERATQWVCGWSSSKKPV